MFDDINLRTGKDNGSGYNQTEMWNIVFILYMLSGSVFIYSQLIPKAYLTLALTPTRALGPDFQNFLRS